MDYEDIMTEVTNLLEKKLDKKIAQEINDCTFAMRCRAPFFTIFVGDDSGNGNDPVRSLRPMVSEFLDMCSSEKEDVAIANEWREGWAAEFERQAKRIRKTITFQCEEPK